MLCTTGCADRLGDMGVMTTAPLGAGVWGAGCLVFVIKGAGLR